MLLKDIIKIIKHNIPIENTMPTFQGERYGGYNIKNPDQKVKRVLYCVTPSDEIREYFIKHKYDLLISHHPFLIDNIPQIIIHTAFDCCKDGLNDIWKNFLQIKNAKKIYENIGVYGDIQPISLDALVLKVESFIGSKVEKINKKNNLLVKKIAVCTGLGGMIEDLVDNLNVDCYITGEGFNLNSYSYNSIEVGHTKTERIGIITLRKLLPDIIINVAPLEIDLFGNEMFKNL